MLSIGNTILLKFSFSLESFISSNSFSTTPFSFPVDSPIARPILPPSHPMPAPIAMPARVPTTGIGTIVPIEAPMAAPAATPPKPPIPCPMAPRFSLSSLFAISSFLFSKLYEVILLFCFRVSMPAFDAFASCPAAW